jgi:hypothetical protein
LLREETSNKNQHRIEKKYESKHRGPAFARDEKSAHFSAAE